ncbi:MAG: TonB-dependent receptor family protein, partial [Crocinitomicaceae bacterium]|nr:TonB-dependent receptor family protein [Crocinitomicaceae bacterium]
KIFLTGLLLMMASIGWSQDMSIKGTVYDSTGQFPVMNAMAMAVRIKDSVLLDYARSDKDGNFQLGGFPLDTFTLTIDHPHFDEKIYYIFGNEDNREITIPSIVMPDKAQQLDEVIIYAYKDPIYYKGDTLVYVADSFATHEGAVVEDLLKKLPGLSVDKDGKITSQGQEISKVLVDGDEFFGDDPTIATKNLGADGIETVEVYEKENEDGIGGDDEKIQVLDLKLKDSAKKGYFGRVSGASDFALTPIDREIGTNPFYEGELLVNKFKGAQKISVFALGSNTPRSSFGFGDAQKFGLDNEETSGSRWNPMASGTSNGIPQTLTAGVYYSDKIGKKKQTKVGFNYSYYNNYLDATSASRSDYFLTDTSYVTDDSTKNISRNESHRININFETKLDSLTTLQIKPGVSLDMAKVENRDISTFLTSNGLQTLGTNILNSTDSKGYSVNGFARINRKFMKKKRELEFRYDISLDDNETDGALNSGTSFFTNGVLINDTTLKQENINDNSNINHFGTLTYIEPIAKKMKLEFEYLYQYGFSTQDKKTFDFDPVSNGFTSENSLLTNNFDNIRQQHRAGAKWIYESTKHRFSAGVKVRNIDIQNVNIVTGSEVNQNITNILPNAKYTYKPSMSKRIGLNYRTSSQQPSVNDLAPVFDNSNPNRLQVGNPDLKPNYMHTLNANFNTWNALSGRYLYAGSSMSLTDNAFSTTTEYDTYGRTIAQTVNVDGNAMVILYSGTGLPFYGRKITVRPELNGTYFRNTNFISSLENVTNTFGINPKLNVDFSLLGDSLEFGFESSYSFNNATSTLNPEGTPYSIGNYGSWIKWKLPFGFGIGADGTFTKNDQPGDGFYDTEYFVLNAQISRNFLKTGNLEVALIGNDILNQNINARREVVGNIVTDYRTTIISRYFLLKMTLRFNNRKTTENDFNGFH